MSEILKTSIKIGFFAFLIVVVQVAVVSQLTDLPINLAFCTIIAFASLLGLLEVSVLCGALVVGSTLLVYNGFIFWIYPVIGIIAQRINPYHIADKLLVSIMGVFVFTPILELLNPSSLNYLQKIISALLFNLITTIPMYFLVKILFYKPKQALSFR
ncbi:MAG: hypothetical protein RLZZ361_578 [Cyanobacteriota bacterium]|jgi:hypothetical protein